MRRSLIVLGVLLLALAPPPAPAQSGTVVSGEHLYGQYCEACHGANGMGVGPPGRTIGGGPLRGPQQQQAMGPSLRGVGALAADFYLRTGYMPLVSQVGDQPGRSRVVFSPRQIGQLVAYVSSLGSGPAIPTPHPERGSLSTGQSLFTDHCAGCHQVLAQGGYVTGAVPPALADATPVQIAEAVRIGPYVMPRFSERAISNRQLDSIIAYVQYTKHPDDAGGWSIGHLGPVPEGIVAWLLAMGALVVVCVVVGKGLARAA